MILNLNPEVKELIRHIADVQISALINISNGNYQCDEEDQELLNQYQSTLQDVKREAKVVITHFEDMQREPLLIGITSDNFLSLMRHILFKIEEEYYNKDAISQLWEIFFYIEKERHPKIKVMVEQIKTSKNGKRINNRIG